jgi:alkylation response protein AidB-like acyl-CoA dehydrogenase
MSSGHVEYRESIEDRRFREEARDWLHANRPKERRPGDGSFEAQMNYDRAWQRAQFDGGWAGIAWPGEYGGRGLSPTQQLIWCEEYASAHCPPVLDSCWVALNHAGPTLIVRGSEAQKRFHLPRILRGEATWCQGFSEPNAGSDLAALRMRGVIDGEDLIVNGQKSWTTFAHLADYQELLVRTGTAESRHRGLTWVICDMRTRGIDVRPGKALDGRYHNCDVYYDDVRIPLSNVVGNINDGWSIVITTFRFERGPASFGGFCEMAVALEELIDYARTHSRIPGQRPLIEDEAIAERIGTVRAQLQSLRALTYMMIAAAEHGVELGNEGSLMHLPYTELDQKIARLALDILGPRSLSRTVSESWVANYLKSFSATILGGTSEIQRNIIGERLLGLPR